MDWIQVITIAGSSIGTGLGVVGLMYSIIRNFKSDVVARIDKLEDKIISIEERMFWLATGKTLKEAILEQKNRK